MSVNRLSPKAGFRRPHRRIWPRPPISSRATTAASTPPRSTCATTSALKAAVDAGVEQLGRLDIIVANAGIGNGGETLDKTSEEDWTDMIDINLSGVWKTVKAGVPHLIEGGRGGSIILTSSVGGMKAYPHCGHYVAAKHGVVGLMRTFAVELGAQNIRVNSVHPTHVSTPMIMNEGTWKMFRPDLENPGPDDMAPICQMFHMLPIPWVDPIDISNAVLFFASDEARYLTGVTLPIDARQLPEVTLAELSIPQGWEAITPDWMTTALAASPSGRSGGRRPGRASR